MKLSWFALFIALVCLVLGVQAVDMSRYNQRKGKQFIKDYAEKEGVLTTESGLAYKIIEPGTGKTHPTKEDSVKVHYRGTLIDGTEFDSSYARNSPATFGVTQVIRGWTEILQLMVEGEKLEVVIPPELGYGSKGAGGKIGPEATLVFTVELLEILGDEEDL